MKGRRDRRLSVLVQGKPATGGSFRAICIAGRGRLLEGGSDQQKASMKAWRAQVVEAARGAATRQRHDCYVDEPLEVAITFCLPKPKSLPRWRWLPWSKSAGDLDKLCRSTLDALVDAQVLDDDSRVVDLEARKRYAVSALDIIGAVIDIAPITERDGT